MELDPFECPGCHEGEDAGFDHFCDVLGVQEHELVHAFAAWLGVTRNFNGKYWKVPDRE